MRGVVCFGEEEFLLDGFVLFFEKEAPVEGAVAGEVDEVNFALDPAFVVGGAAGEGGIEELAMVEADVDDDGVGVVLCFLMEILPDLPSSFFIEVGELEGLDMDFDLFSCF